MLKECGSMLGLETKNKESFDKKKIFCQWLFEIQLLNLDLITGCGLHVLKLKPLTIIAKSVLIH